MTGGDNGREKRKTGSAAGGVDKIKGVGALSDFLACMLEGLYVNERRENVNCESNSRGN